MVYVYFTYILFFYNFLLTKMLRKEKVVMLFFKQTECAIYGILYGRGTLDRLGNRLIIFTLILFYIVLLFIRKKSTRKCNLFLVPNYTQREYLFCHVS